MKQTLLTGLLVCLLFSCQSDPTIQEQLIGTWENTSLTVTMKLADGSDSAMVINDGEWEATLKIKPIVTTYSEDGSFKSEYFSLDDKPLGTEAGEWTVRNDSLILKSQGYDNAYKVVFDGDKVRFISVIDWDQDGLADDHYDGWQKRVNK